MPVHVLLFQLRVFLLCAFVIELGVSNFRLVFQLGHLLVGLVRALVLVVAVMPDCRLSDDLCLVRTLNGGVFLLHLMNLAMNGRSEGITDLSGSLFGAEGKLALLLGFFQLVLKVKAGFALAGFLVKNALLFNDLVRRQLLTGSVQPLMCLFGFALKPLHFRCGNRGIRLRCFRSRLSGFGQYRVCIRIPDG